MVQGIQLSEGKAIEEYGATLMLGKNAITADCGSKASKASLWASQVYVVYHAYPVKVLYYIFSVCFGWYTIMK